MPIVSVVFDVGETLLNDTREYGAWAGTRQPALTACAAAGRHRRSGTREVQPRFTPGPSPGADVSRTIARTRSPSARHAAATPTAPQGPQRAEVPGRLLLHDRQGAAPAPQDRSDRRPRPGPRRPRPDRDRDRLARNTRAAMSYTVVKKLAHQQDSHITARVTGASTPPTKERAIRACSVRPASVTLPGDPVHARGLCVPSPCYIRLSGRSRAAASRAPAAPPRGRCARL